jgi:ribosomal protein S18 acetylase RimI-like enzyme
MVPKYKVLEKDFYGDGKWVCSYLGKPPVKVKGSYNPAETKGYAIGQLSHGILYIGDVEVKIPYRKQGYGRLLVNHLIKNSKAKTIYVVGVIHAAKGFWKKLKIKEK